jgi:hypothetical protein
MPQLHRPGIAAVADSEADEMGENLRGLGFLEFSASNVVFGRCSGGRRARFAREAYDKLGLYGKTMGVASPPRVWGGTARMRRWR